MTDEQSKIDDELLPETRNHSLFFWYMAGVGVATFGIGVMGLLELPPNYEELAVGGGMILLVVVSWVMLYD